VKPQTIEYCSDNESSTIASLTGSESLDDEDVPFPLEQLFESIVMESAEDLKDAPECASELIDVVGSTEEKELVNPTLHMQQQEDAKEQGCYTEGSLNDSFDNETARISSVAGDISLGEEGLSEQLSEPTQLQARPEHPAEWMMESTEREVGAAKWKNEDLIDALKACEEALATYEREGLSFTPGAIHVLHDIAALKHRCGDLDGAHEVLIKARMLMQQMDFPMDHLDEDARAFVESVTDDGEVCAANKAEPEASVGDNNSSSVVRDLQCKRGPICSAFLKIGRHLMHCCLVHGPGFTQKRKRRLSVIRESSIGSIENERA